MRLPSPALVLCLLALCLPAHAVQDTQLADWPAVRVPKEDWAKAAATARTADWPDWLAARESQLQSWMAKSPEDATQPVGWLQNYVDPATGKFLQWTPHTPPPADVTSKSYAAWRANVRIYNVEQILESARLYRLTGKTAYLEWAKGQLDAYALNYITLPLQTWNGQARLFSQALDEAVYAFTLLDAVRLLRPHVPAADVERWRDGLFVPMAVLLRLSIKGYDNISLWITASLSVMADEFQLAELNTFAQTGLQSILAQGVSADNYWYEMSLHYQDYVVNALATWLYAYGIRPDGLGGKEQLRTQIGTTTRNLMLSPLYIRFSNSDAPALNDTQGARKIPNTAFWSTLWRVLPTPSGLNAARAVKSWDTLLDPPPASSVATEALPKVESKVVAGLDSVQLASRNWQALLRYGAKGTHAHQEAFSYDLKYDRVWIFRDQGTVGYGSPLHLNYFRRAHAHAAPLIDRDGQLPWPAEGRLLNFTAPGTAKAEQTRYSRGHSVSRELRIDASGFNDSVEFKLIGTTPKPVGLVFNTRCQPTYTTDAPPQAEDSLSKIGPFQYWTQRAQYAIGSKLEVGLDCGGQKFTLSFEGADLRTLFTASVPDTGKDLSRGFYLETQPVLNSTIKLRIQAVGI